MSDSLDNLDKVKDFTSELDLSEIPKGYGGLTDFEYCLDKEGLLERPAFFPSERPVLGICFDFTSDDLQSRQPIIHYSHQLTRVDQMVKEVFTDCNLYPVFDNNRRHPEPIVDGFPASFWDNFEESMLCVLYCMKGSRLKRNGYTRCRRRRHDRELRRRRHLEGHCLHFSILQYSDNVRSQIITNHELELEDIDDGNEEILYDHDSQVIEICGDTMSTAVLRRQQM